MPYQGSVASTLSQKTLMKTALFLLASVVIANANVVQFDLSPAGTSPAVGLHPLNEIIPGDGTGYGNEIADGVFLDPVTKLLTLNLAYGSAFGFGDLTTPAFSWLLHGPSPADETAPVLFNLESFHTFAANHTQGGRISGSFTLNDVQEAALLSGLSYINIYTPSHLGGEIRGQLVVVPEPQTALLLGGGMVLIWFGQILRKRTTARQ